MGQRIFHVIFSPALLTQGAVSILSLFLLLAVSLADDDHDIAKRLKDTTNIVPMARILKTLDSLHLSQVLELKLQAKQGRLVYTIEYVDTQGVVWQRGYDATSGLLLRTSQGK